jgi:very-short-patch-repair endonuclease
MLTGVFRDRTRLRRLGAQPAHRALHELIHSRELTPYRAARYCEIGPFVVDYVYKERSLIVELEPPDEAAWPRTQARISLLNSLGYRVLLLSRREVRRAPRQTLERIKAALRAS